MRDDVERSFAKVLNSHGYPFQHGVAAHVQARHRSGASPWRVEAIEMPVSVRDSPTRIDMVLMNATRPVWIAAECKRANPGLANWCFAPAPRILGGASTNVMGEQVWVPPNSVHPVARGATAGSTPAAYDIALEVRANTKGDVAGKGRGEIEEAVTQVFRGSNGLIEFALANRALVKREGPLVVVTAVFTTAALWTSDVALERTDLLTGEVDHSDARFVRCDWLAYRYRLTPNLRHSGHRLDDARSVQHALERDFLRTVFVVHADGIDAFLDWAASRIGPGQTV